MSGPLSLFPERSSFLATGKSDGQILLSNAFDYVQRLRPTKFASNSQNQSRHPTIMFNEFSQAGLLKQLDNDTRLLMLDESDEFFYNRTAFNIIENGRVNGDNSVRCILLQLWNCPPFYSKGTLMALTVGQCVRDH